jgi:GTP cyclohydrolase I
MSNVNPKYDTVTETSTEFPTKELADARRSMFQNDLLDATEKYVEVMTKFTPMNSSEAENMKYSAQRMAKALSDMILPKEAMVYELRHILKDAFPVALPNSSVLNLENRTPLVLSQSPIRANSLCPHHFLPVQYTVFVAVKINTGTNDGSSVFGLSKYSRAVQVLAKRPVLQEQFARDIVELFTASMIGGTEYVDVCTVSGCMVVVSGVHGCMSCRGIESDTPTQTCYSAGMDANEQQLAWNLYNGRERN